MPDSLVRVQLQATGADQILATLRAVRQEVALLGQQSARINLAANTTVVSQQLGQITNELTRINAMTARARVDLDSTPAMEKIAALESRLTAYTARPIVVKVQADTTEAMRQLTQYEQDAARVQARVQQQQTAAARTVRSSGSTGRNIGGSLASAALTGSPASALSALVAPEVTVPVAVAFAASQFIVQPLLDSIDSEVKRISQTEATKNIDIGLNAQFNLAASNQAEVSAEARAQLEAQKTDLQNMIAGESAGGGNKTAVDYLQQQLDKVNKALQETAPVQKSADALSVLATRLKEVNTDLEHNRLTTLGASTAAEQYGEIARENGAAVQAVSDALDDFNKKTRDSFIASAAHGALGGASAVQTAVAELAQVYQNAATVISRVDLSKGLSGLAAAAPGLDTARDALAAFGQSSTALTSLSSIADQFKEITDQENAASAAYRGYMGLLTETDRRIQQAQADKQRVTAAVKQADQDRSLGIATPAELELLKGYQPILTNLDAIITRLKQGEVPDILGFAKNYPDLKKSDDDVRDLIGQLGGPKELTVRVQSTIDEATKQLLDMLNAPQPIPATVIVRTVNADGTSPIMPGGFSPYDEPASTSGYARPTTQRLVGGGPYGSGTLYQPGGAIGSAGGGGGGWNTFQPLSQAQYGGIVSSGPLANPQVYAGVMAAAQEYNVDPRALLAFVKNEGVAPSLAAVNNFGGIKGKGGPPAPANEGGTYAAYSSPTDFFRSLAANLTTGAYAGDYQSGNLAAVRQRYVAGSATPSAAQQANIANTVSSYNDLVQQYPSGAGGVITPQAPESSSLTSRVSLTQPTPIQAGAGQTVSPNQVAAMRKRANELAGSAYVYGGGHSSQDAGGFDCSGYVIEVLRAGGINAPFTDAGGLYKWAQTAEGSKLLDAAGIQLGFYNPGAGGMNEHVGINIGGDWFESGGQRGDTAGPSPNAAKGFNKFVGTPHAVAAATGGDIALAQTTGAGTSDLTAAATAGGSVAAGIRAGIAGVQGTSVGQTLAGLDPKDAQAALAAYQQLLPVFQQIANTKLPDEPFRAADDAMQQGIGFLGAWAQGLQAIRGQTDGLAAAEQQITDIVGGPLAANLNKQLEVMSSQAQIASQITQLTDRKQTLEADHAAIVAQRQHDDQTASRAQTMQGWADQAADSQRQHARRMAQQALQSQTTAENQGYLGTTRGLEDQGTAADRAHTIAARQFEDQINAITKAQQTNSAGNTIASEVFAAQAGGPGTRDAKRLAAENLLIQKEYEARAKDTLTSQLDGIKTAEIAETRRYEDAKYNIQQEGVEAARAHEDRVAALQQESQIMQDANAAQDEQIQATRTARDQSYQIQQWQIEDQRSREDAAYQAAAKAIDDEIAKQQELATTADAALSSLQSAATLLGQTGDQLSQTLGAAVTSAQSASSGFLQSQPVSGGAIKRLAAGGTIPPGGTALVGDAPGGGITPFTEQVFAPGGAVVTPLRNRVVSGDGGAITVNAPITVNADPNVEATIRSILAPIEAQLRAALTPARTGGSGRKAG